MPPEYREPAGDLPGAPSGHDMGVLMAILVVALAVRLAGLGAPLWFDEIVTVQTQLRLPWSAMMQSYSMNHHYLFSVEAKLATALFGETIWAIRLPALLFGLGTVAAVWWLARDVAGPRIAHVAALLVALSYHQVWFSQNARGYTELAFFSTLGLIFFLRGMERPARGTWIGFGLALAGAVFTHLTGVFFFAGLGLLWLGALGSRAAAGRLVPGIVARPLQGVFAAGVLLILLYLPVVPEVIRTIGAVAGTSAVDPMQEYQSPLWSVVEGLRSAIGSAGAPAALIGIAAAAVIALGAIGMHRRAPLFAPAIAAHVLVTVAVLMALDMRIWPRFFFTDIGLAMILVVAGCATGARLAAQLLARPALGRGLFAACVLVLLVVSAGLLQRNYRAPKQDLAGAFAAAESARTEGERIYALGPGAEIFQGFFHADWGRIDTAEDYAAAMEAPGALLLVIAFPDRMFRTIPALARDSAGPLTLVRRLPGTLGDGYVLIYRRPG